MEYPEFQTGIFGRMESAPYVLYVEPTEKDQYLLKSSCHPSHINPIIGTLNPAKSTLSNMRQVISRNINILRSSQRCLAAYHRCKTPRDKLVGA